MIVFVIFFITADLFAITDANIHNIEYIAKKLKATIDDGIYSLHSDIQNSRNEGQAFISNIQNSINSHCTSWRGKLSQSLMKLKTRDEESSKLNKKKNVNTQNRINEQTRGKLRAKTSFLARLRGGKNNKKKILILLSDTGGGHRASGQSLEHALHDRYPGKMDVELVDIWTDYAAYPFNNFVPYYRFLQKYSLLWRMFYNYGLFTPTKKFTEAWTWVTCHKSFKSAITSRNPDVVVSVHPLCHNIPVPVVQEMNKERAASNQQLIPFITVVTDLGDAHSTWFDKRVNFCYVPSEVVKKVALKRGLRESQIIFSGLPVRPAFWKSLASKDKLRKLLGLKNSVSTVLVMGGGDGVGGIDKVALRIGDRLGQAKTPSQVIVICGHNRQLSDKLQSKSWPSNVNVVVKGFVNNIDEYMGASDLLVTKAGPGTIAESMIRGLPMILSSFLPGQVKRLSLLSFTTTRAFN
jgi:1,2-diacylglycerol 3-beta-galactosyltransferase